MRSAGGWLSGGVGAISGIFCMQGGGGGIQINVLLVNTTENVKHCMLLLWLNVYLREIEALNHGCGILTCNTQPRQVSGNSRHSNSC